MLYNIYSKLNAQLGNGGKKNEIEKIWSVDA